VRTFARCLLLIVLALFFGNISASARPSKTAAAYGALSSQPSAVAVDAAPAPSAILLAGVGLLVLGGVLRRRLRTVPKLRGQGGAEP
jgi:MYXO-CTERM domain-containing protein